MTYKAPDYLEDDPWFGPATLSVKQLALKKSRKEARPKEIMIEIHKELYKRASTKVETTLTRDPLPWLSGVGMI